MTYRVWLIVIVLVTATGALGQDAPEPFVPDFPWETLEASVQRQFDAAVAALRAAPDDAAAQGRLGMLFHAYDIQALAAPCYERAIDMAAADPGAWRWRYLLGMVRADDGAIDEAISLFESTTAAAYGPAVWLRLGDLYRQQGREDEAFEAYGLVRASGRNVAHAACGLGRLALARRAYDAAEGFLAEAVERADEYGAAWYAYALTLRGLGRNDEAMAAFERAEQFRDREPDLADPAARALAGLAIGAVEAMQRGASALEARDIESAVRWLRQAVSLDPDLMEAHSQLGTAYLLAGADREAAAAFERAIQLNDRFADALYGLGFIAYRAGDDERALTLFGRGVESRPDHFDVRLGLALTLRRSGAADAAVEHFRRAIELRPADSRPYRHLASYHAETGDWAAAIAILRRAHRAIPADRALAVRLARLLVTVPDAALRDADEADRLLGPLGVPTGAIAAMVEPPAIVELEIRAAVLAERGAFAGAVEMIDAALAVLARRTPADEGRKAILIAWRADFAAGRPVRLRADGGD